MACKTSFELHHNFPKIAEESGFAFNAHRPRIHIDWNKIRLLDLESLVRDRKFVLIEQHVHDILDCVLESEFDVRILDEGVVKLFRLAQLAVEYQQFCRHYLDRSVYVLREELSTIVQDLDSTKKTLREKDEELRKIRRKSKHSFRTPLPYGNENIATMILKTLSNKADMFPSTSNTEIPHYNKCKYCDKVFLNQLYLQSHISRRHPNTMIELPERDVKEIPTSSNNIENDKLKEEIMELKTKLKEMEQLITRTKENQSKPTEIVTPAPIVETTQIPAKPTVEVKNMKDAEVSTNNESYFLDKIEEWKKEEREKYNKEINLLRTQILDTITNMKEKENPKPAPDNSLIDQLHKTIKDQGTEIVSLKQELINSKIRSEKEEMERKKEAETQMSYWTSRVEAQSKQYDVLLQKLNEVAKEGQESRAIAIAESERATQLQALLEKALTKPTTEVVRSQPPVQPAVPVSRNKQSEKIEHNKNGRKKSLNKTKTVGERKTLDELHRKAQELLNMGSLSSSDDSSIKIDKKITTAPKETKEVVNELPKHKKEKSRNVKSSENNNNQDFQNMEQDHLEEHNTPKKKERKVKKQKPKLLNKTQLERNGIGLTPGSPMKVIRARVTEEVNNRLVTLGVDPLKSRLPQSVFQKQRSQIQQKQELKFKKNPAQEKVRHSILAYLDSTTAGNKKDTNEIKEYTSPNKSSKVFSLTSVISNVKSKALAFVKSNDIKAKIERNTLKDEVAQRAMTLLKTPPGSPKSSPNPKASSILSSLKETTPMKTKERKEKRIPRQIDLEDSMESNSESTESDHKYYNSAVNNDAHSKSIDSLVKSPARRPSSANNTSPKVLKYTVGNGDIRLERAQSATDISGAGRTSGTNNHASVSINANSSDDVESLVESPIKKFASEENINEVPKQTKSVLKNASSTSSLNKKKVIFDMDAIQMKSVSASPSQSLTEKSDGNEKYELGLVNLDDEEWDISSIDNEPLKNNTKIHVNTRTSPKIAELKKTIESQLVRRTETPSTAIVGGIDVLRGPMAKTASLGGSNTSLGSSILDESESLPVQNHKAFVKPKDVVQKDYNDFDLSELSIDALANKIENESF